MLTRLLSPALRVAVAAFALGRAAAALAQSAPCTYAACALGIAPRLTALDVVRGDTQVTAGSLSFVWPHAALVRAFDGDSTGRHLAGQAIRTRRLAAMLTDVGLGLIAVGVFRATATASGRRGSLALAGGGVAVLGASVPVQFAADAQLSRAVFEFNRRFSR